MGLNWDKQLGGTAKGLAVPLKNKLPDELGVKLETQTRGKALGVNLAIVRRSLRNRGENAPNPFPVIKS